MFNIPRGLVKIPGSNSPKRESLSGLTDPIVPLKKTVWHLSEYTFTLVWLQFDEWLHTITI